MKTVESEGKTYAHFFLSAMPSDEEVQFITQDKDPIQVGIFKRDANYHVKAHSHLPRKLDLEHVGEFLLIQSGAALVKIYDEDWNLLCAHTVNTGDCAIFLRGGHELTMLEPTRILEVKQGPFIPRPKDKTFRPTS